MDVSKEIERLDELLLTGALTDEEYAVAKAGLLGDTVHQSLQDRLKWPQIGCGYVTCLLLLLTAFMAFGPTAGRWVLLLCSGLVFIISTLETIARLIHVPARVVHSVFWVLPVLGALVTNPDQPKLEQNSRRKVLRDTQRAQLPVKSAEAVLAKTSYEIQNYYLFSLGTFKSGIGIGGAKLKLQLLGVYGHWWFELLEKPLFEQIRGLVEEESVNPATDPNPPSSATPDASEPASTRSN